MTKNILQNLFWNPTPQNKAEAIKLNEAMNMEKTILNFSEIGSSDSEFASMIKSVKLFRMGAREKVNAYNKHYDIDNSKVFTYENPLSKWKMEKLEWGLRNTTKGAKATFNGFKTIKNNLPKIEIVKEMTV